MSELRILLTAFEPFAGSSRNPSAEVASRIGRHPSKGIHVRSAVLPVSTRRAPLALERLLEEFAPDRVLSLGEGRGMKRLRVERLARNRLDFQAPDNDGVELRDQLITRGGPATLVCGLPVVAMIDRLVEIGVPCELSGDAGGFLCNQIMYLALEWCERHGARGGFVHLPGLDGDVNGGLPLALELRAVEELLTVIAADAAHQDTAPRP